METYYAPAERASHGEIAEDVKTIGGNRVIDSLMRLTGGLVAVLNKQRQILALNDNYLEYLGITDPARVLGLRPGEAAGCSHSHDMPGGCGTSRHCASCGAAIALVTCRELDHPVEQKCCITVGEGKNASDRFFLVRAGTIVIDNELFILLFLQDATAQQNRDILERVFLHDLSNLAGGILGTAEYLTLEPGDDSCRAEIFDMASLLAREINIHKSLINNDLADYAPLFSDVPLDKLARDTARIFANHEAAADKTITVDTGAPDLVLRTDYYLLTRIVQNMLKNALEATAPGGAVKLSCSARGDKAEISVWNDCFIPEEKALRIFQRNYSTKDGPGRGLGTYCMKFFGEKVLGGNVGFTSSPENGTQFHISLALH